MARIRSVHPGLFTDEVFMALSMAARVFLTGVWTESDDHGVFEWKPLTLKARILPADNVDAGEILAELQGAGVVARFESTGRPYGAVRNFCRYQRPKKPKYPHPLPDELRTYVGLTEAVPPTVPHPSPTGGKKSPQMEEEGGDKEDEEKKDTPRATRARVHVWPTDFEGQFWDAYPKRVDKQAALRALRRVWKADKVPWERVIGGVRSYVSSTVGTDRQFIKSPEVWLNKGCWDDEFAPPASLTNGASVEVAGLIHVNQEDPRWGTLSARYRQEKGKSPPVDKHGGWRFPEAWMTEGKELVYEPTEH